MENPVLIFGAKGLGKVALDIFEENNVIVYGFLDDDKSLHGKMIGELTILGETEDELFLNLLGKQCEAFIAIDDNRVRKHLVKNLTSTFNVMPVNAIHKTVLLEKSSFIGHGNMLCAGVIISSFCEIGNHTILNIGTKIDAEVKIHDFVQIGMGSLIGAGVSIEEGVFIGAGVSIVAGVTIGKNARVGAGSLVLESVEAGSTVFGSPAKKI